MPLGPVNQNPIFFVVERAVPAVTRKNTTWNAAPRQDLKGRRDAVGEGGPGQSLYRETTAAKKKKKRQDRSGGKGVGTRRT